MSDQKRREVNLRIANTGITLELPEEDDGKLLPKWRRFQSLKRLVEMWWRVDEQLRDGKAISPNDAQAMHSLMRMLVNTRNGPKLLAAMQEYHRRQLQTDLRLLQALVAFKEMQAREDVPDQSEAEERQFRRQMTLLKKHGLIKRRGSRTTTLGAGCP